MNSIGPKLTIWYDAINELRGKEVEFLLLSELGFRLFLRGED